MNVDKNQGLLMPDQDGPQVALISLEGQKELTPSTRVPKDLLDQSLGEATGGIPEGVLDTTERSLTADERRQVLYEWNETEVNYGPDKCIHELFEEQVARTPDAAAVIFEDQSLSYSELNRRSNQLAHHLRALGIRPDARVAICVERGLEMVIALLGVLKAGGAYVPLDPAYPVERLHFMLEDSAPLALITQSHLAGLFPEMGDRLPVLDMTAATPAWHGLAESNPDRASIGLNPDHLAYIIYTSGSTGKPKGVMVQHGSVANLFFGLRESVYINHQAPGLRVAVNGSIAFDTSVKQFVQLLQGHSLDIVPEGVRYDSGALLRFVRERGINVLDCTPSQLRLLLEEGLLGESAVRSLLVLVGGESIDGSMWPSLANSSQILFFNLYGPTECTVDSSVCLVSTVGTPSIGRPLANTRIYILDDKREPVAVGVEGELYIGGAGVARGYLNRPEQTAERFVADPFAAEPGARMYRTGDFGCWLADGNIEFHGRIDFQVKIRGFRIELGEIEARLREAPTVREAVVVAREDEPGDKRLVAYYTGARIGEAEQASLGAEQLRSYLSARFPEHMVPAAYVRLDALPLTPNGKLDRQGLPAPKADSYSAASYDPPEGEIETELARIWAEVLKLDRVGRQDNFFSIGGHSLMAVRVVTRLRQTLHAEVAIRDLFAHPVLADLARIVKGSGRSVLAPIKRVARHGTSSSQMHCKITATRSNLDRAATRNHRDAGSKLQPGKGGE